jgi:6-phosphogluconate dehydrogenase
MDDGFDLGLFGLDALGGDLARSMAARDISLAVCPGPGGATASIDGVQTVKGIDELVSKLKSPRALLLRAPQGFAEALQLVEPEDVIIDASDSWFRDTHLRANAAAAKGVHFLSAGLSRNENGPSPLLMLGGRLESLNRVGKFLADQASSHALLGHGSAGHFVKMAHAAVDNAFAEIVREIQLLLDRGLGAEAGDLLRVRHGDPLFDCLRQAAASCPSESGREMGRWAVRAGHELEIPMLTLEAASGVRSWPNRQALAEPFCQPHGALRNDSESLVAQAHGALSVATIMAYTEALALLTDVSGRVGLGIDVLETMRLWRVGVKSRGRLLEEIQSAFEATPGLPNLLFDDDFSERVMEQQEFLRHAVWQADEWNISTPTLASALRYIDTFRGAWLPINLIQPRNFHWTPRPALDAAVTDWSLA